MLGNEINGSALQENATKLADGKAELELVMEELPRKKALLEEADAAIQKKRDEHEQITAHLEAARIELAGLDTEIENKSIQAAKGPSENVTVDEKLTVKFVIPTFNFNGTVYNSKEVEAAIANEEAWAMELAIELADIKSGVIEVVNQTKGGA